MALKIGQFGKQIRTTRKDIECDTGEVWRRSWTNSIIIADVLPRVMEERKSYILYEKGTLL
jgi:hypothetical protein